MAEEITTMDALDGIVRALKNMAARLESVEAKSAIRQINAWGRSRAESGTFGGLGSPPPGLSEKQRQEVLAMIEQAVAKEPVRY